MKSAQNKKKMRPGWVQALIAIIIVAAGAFGAYLFIKSKKPPQQKETKITAPLVEVEKVRVRDIQMLVRGYGTVSPKVEIDIVSEVSGKVVSLHRELKAGGMIRAGEPILKIDPRDYEYAVQQAESIVAEAQVRVDTELAEAGVARKEWEQLHPNTEPNSPLVLREPQIRRAQAALKSASAQLATAQLRLDRTSLSIPFDALIISERVDLGQYVVVGQSLGEAYGIESVEIVVPLEDNELAWFDVFNGLAVLNGGKSPLKNTIAQVKTNFAGAEHTWQGWVVRTTGQVDKTSRMISVVVEVPRPFDTSNGKPPLLPGVFVEVVIEGKVLSKAVAIPRDAVRQGNKVWVVNDGHLYIRQLDIVRTDKDFAYVLSGLDDETLIITSSLDVVTEGKKVRTSSKKAQGPGANINDPNRPEAK